jgi:hypothetical protein
MFQKAVSVAQGHYFIWHVLVISRRRVSLMKLTCKRTTCLFDVKRVCVQKKSCHFISKAFQLSNLFIFDLKHNMTTPKFNPNIFSTYGDYRPTLTEIHWTRGVDHISRQIGKAASAALPTVTREVLSVVRQNNVLVLRLRQIIVPT